MNFKKILATAVSAVVLTTGMAIAAFADSTLTLTSSRGAVVRGESFTISLQVEGTDNIGSADIDLMYDTNVFKCVGAESDFDGFTYNPLNEQNDPKTFSVSVADLQAKKVNGKLFKATFTVDNNAVGGSYEFKINSSEISNEKAETITTSLDGNVAVEVKAPDKLAAPAVTINNATKTASWAAITNAGDYNVVLKKGEGENAVELYNNNQKLNEFNFAKYVTETGTYTVIVKANQNGSLYLASDAGSVSADFVVPAVLSITEKDYVAGSNGFDVVITLNGNTFTGIEGLTKGTDENADYTVAGNVVHINEKALSESKTLTFNFTGCDALTLKVKVTPAANGATFILAEREADDKYFTEAKQDVDTVANDGTTEGLIVIAHPEAPVTNFLGVQFTISNNANVGYDAVKYEIVPADGFALLYDDATGLYEINVKPVDGVRPAVSEAAAGQGIVIGKLVYNGGYGQGTISAENVMLTVEKSDNTYKEISATNAGFEFKYDIPEPAKNLTVVVDLSKHYAKVDNVKAYQNMKLRVYSARLGFIDFDLGTDSVAYSEKNGTLETTGAVAYDIAKKTYTLTLEKLPAFDKYTVFVSGDGYRDAKAQFDLNENTTVNFWNNANDSAIAEISKATSGIVKTAKKNFLAGDIIMNGVIDIYDLSAVSSYYGKSNLTAGDKDFIQYDLNRDGKVNLDDISILLAGWAE